VERLNGEMAREVFASKEELIEVAIANYGSVCQFEHARMEIGFACQDSRLHVYLKDGRRFFRTQEVLAFAESWPASPWSREPTAVERKSPFPRAKFPDLLNFLRDCPEIMTRSKQKEAARQHFPNHHLPESLFREIFRQDPADQGGIRNRDEQLWRKSLPSRSTSFESA
jgi:hypothetical protein